MYQDLIIKWKVKLNLEQNWIKGNKILNVAKVQISHKRIKKTCSRKIVDKNKVFMTEINKSACNYSEFHILNSNASFTDYLWMLWWLQWASYKFVYKEWYHKEWYH